MDMLSMGATALVLAVLGAAIFFIFRTQGTDGLLMSAAGGVMMLVSMALGLVAAVRNNGRGTGIIAFIIAIMAAVISEIR